MCARARMYGEEEEEEGGGGRKGMHTIDPHEVTDIAGAASSRMQDSIAAAVVAVVAPAGGNSAWVAGLRGTGAT